MAKKNKIDAFWDNQQLRWAKEKYEVINFSKLVKNKNELSNHYEELLEKILQTSFKNIISVVDILNENDVRVNAKSTKEEIVQKLQKVNFQNFEVTFLSETFNVNVFYLIQIINENDLSDLLKGNLIIIFKPYYNEIETKKKSNKKNKNKEFKKIKFIILAIGIFIALILLLLTIYSQHISDFLTSITNSIRKWTGDSINPAYSSIFIGFIRFILEAIIVYIFYVFFTLMLKIIFKAIRKNELKKELTKSNKLEIDLKEKLIYYKEISNKIIKKTNSAVKGITLFLRIVMIIVIFLLVLNFFNINLTSILATTTLLTIVLTVGAQSTLGDYFAGLLFTFDDYYNVGDLVKIDTIQGRVISANLRRVCVETFDKEKHFIMHSQIKHVINYSKDFNKAKVVFDIAYESNPKEVIKLLNTFLSKNWKKNKNIKEEPDVLAITDFHDSGIGFVIYAECERETRWEVERWIRIEIFELFKENNIEIPYQKITIYNKK